MLGITDLGLFRISESTRLHIIGNMVSALTAQKAFLNNFENVVNHRVDIREDIKHYQDTLSYTISKVNHSMEENIYMMPNDMNLKIKVETAGYNNQILVSDSGFSLGRNSMVNTSAPEKMSHMTPIIPKHTPMPKAADKEFLSMPKHTSAITHKGERITLVLALTSAFGLLYTFQ